MILNPLIVEKLNMICDDRGKLYHYISCQIIESLATGFPLPDIIFSGEFMDKLDDTFALLNHYKLVKFDIVTKEYELIHPLLVSSEEISKKEITTTKINNSNVRSIVEKNIDDYRNCFSKNGEGKKGLRPGSLGDRNDIIKKLINWFKTTNFAYTMEDVINTASVYVDSCKNDHYKFLQAADYFISKDGRSRLSAYIDEFKNRKVEPVIKNTLDI